MTASVTTLPQRMAIPLGFKNAVGEAESAKTGSVGHVTMRPVRGEGLEVDLMELLQFRSHGMIAQAFEHRNEMPRQLQDELLAGPTGPVPLKTSHLCLLTLLETGGLGDGHDEGDDRRMGGDIADALALVERSQDFEGGEVVGTDDLLVLLKERIISAGETDQRLVEERPAAGIFEHIRRAGHGQSP